MSEKIIVVKGSENITLIGNTGERIMDILNSRHNANYTFPCGGNGRCGKCVIRVLEGCFDITDDDKKFFSKKELQEGYRLACRAVLKDNCTIEYKGALEETYDIQSAYVEIDEEAGKSEKNKMPECKTGLYGIAIDIGTTTIAMSVIDKASNKTLHTHTRLNRQRKFGADVIARIQASNEGKANEIKATIIKDLYDGINAMFEAVNIQPENLCEIVIAGNTTMGHLLLGYSCETLGVYPFTPVDISAKSLSVGQLFEDVENTIEGQIKSDEKAGSALFSKLKNVSVFMIPGISTYVGADITSGIYHCKITEKKEVSIIVDLGTNGEMAIGNCDKLLVTSTAAGPAFEGGNISCGTGSIDGAVCNVKITDTGVELKTINDCPATGICGTGVISVTAQLLENELIDETGRLEDDYFDEGFVLDKSDKISFTQKDVREIQLAKSAIRAGMETLILRYGIDKSDVTNVYLAGGFGYHIDLREAALIGLLPEEFIDKTIAVGNSSLGGASHILMVEDDKTKLNKICEMAEEISLSNDRDFQEFYMDYMMFEED